LMWFLSTTSYHGNRPSHIICREFSSNAQDSRSNRAGYRGAKRGGKGERCAVILNSRFGWGGVHGHFSSSSCFCKLHRRTLPLPAAGSLKIIKNEIAISFLNDFEQPESKNGFLFFRTDIELCSIMTHETIPFLPRTILHYRCLYSRDTAMGVIKYETCFKPYSGGFHYVKSYRFLTLERRL